jgi:hypothetical protein
MLVVREPTPEYSMFRSSGVIFVQIAGIRQGETFSLRQPQLVGMLLAQEFVVGVHDAL